MKAYQVITFGFVLIFSTGAIAGKTIVGKGATPELACWDYEYKANEHARDKTTCYVSCKLDKTQFDGDNYYFKLSAPNHKGSCKAKKYDRGYKGRREFLSANPKPGTRPLPPVVRRSDADLPKRGINIVTWQPNVPSSERARLIIENKTSDYGITAYSISVRDSRYSFPARVIEQGEIILEPNTSWTKEFHQWGGVEWNLESE